MYNLTPFSAFLVPGHALKSVTHHSGSSVTYHSGSYHGLTADPAIYATHSLGQDLVTGCKFAEREPSCSASAVPKVEAKYL